MTAKAAGRVAPRPRFLPDPGPNPGAARLRAVLGPTNTGKTHLAVERMLSHGSGMLGFPLRLLARENYERMVAAKGAGLVGLITGEEKIIPPGARWFACTVEAMPLDRQVDFLGVDEIQLCADAERGHIFTARLLHARGREETMFLGAETIRPLLRQLVPGIEIETRPRLSRLVYAGRANWTRLPPRSAIVAFSATEVYAIAEQLRRRHGGCAVVMGRLSPRTRNAQVALYQSKQVDYLVATDAIGMGLNMEIDHVAFAGIAKFDGRRHRFLSDAELAQIAGRAGRGQRDGSFGTTEECPELDDATIAALENHRFRPIPGIFWRNDALDFASLDTLRASLNIPPGQSGLIRAGDASDVRVLEALARDAGIREAAPGRLRLLWEVCQIPDFQQISDEQHRQLCGRVFLHLAGSGRIPRNWIDRRMLALARQDGDIDTLMQRLAGVRVWSYIAQRADWLDDAPGWQDRTRAVEDRLSDALHERLTARFVDERATHLKRSIGAGQPSATIGSDGAVLVAGHRVGRLVGLSFTADETVPGADRRLVQRAAQRALRHELPRRIERLIRAGHEAFSLDAAGHIRWEAAAVATLAPGPDLVSPRLRLLAPQTDDARLLGAVAARLQGFLVAEIAQILRPVFALQTRFAQTPALRGLVHLLVGHGGVLPAEAVPVFTAATGAELARHGVVGGRFALFLPALLRPRPAGLRALLWQAQAGLPSGTLPALPRPGAVSLAMAPAAPPGFWRDLGWLAAGPGLLRLDVAEHLATMLHARLGQRLPAGFASRIGCRAEALPDMLATLGFRLDEAGLLNPLRPAAPRRLRRPAAAIPGGPFAALAVLQSGR